MNEAEKIIDLKRVIDEFAWKTVKTIVPTSVELVLGNGENIRRTNKALENMDDDRRIEFLLAFLKLWKNAYYNRTNRKVLLLELREIVGDKLDDVIGMRLMYTLTRNGQQFRAWYGIPSTLCPDHAESHGDGILFSVHGEKENIERYVGALVHNKDMVVELPNGVRMWGFYWSDSSY
ncbi:MAG: hypothetical protein UT11_C0010G0010 [Berkelbacteria bacterium GW2011_GWA2_38_9]|uniref:Uncharacterized protein n=1 Tax=Berkelbacteria bacterium GW2011_GWA2_38_9 TaxID=1618334 RepID=A0A0G0LEF1_9BACT|nr:MAG: hypothetical protein UT11_C0010G0010 [Berkelbacteria bacterium GW2011_GWA2_38_9]